MRSRLTATIMALALLSCTSTPQPTLYTQHVVFPEGATLNEKVEMISRLVPSEGQLSWQQLELSAFIHFGMNTFTGSEWGSGKDSPELFNPTELDCEQWVRTLKEGGFRLVILTAKHHDGFCLWPTATTDYSVKQSPWREGKGDVVRELRDACLKYDMKFGVYLSPWDRNAKSYGDSPAYNNLYIAQLTELLTQYGHIDEVWFDGACGEGENGRKQEYDWRAILRCVEEHQPHAVTAIMGDDIRWVGNEGGVGRETEWSATMIAPGSYVDKVAENKRLGLEEMSKDLGSRELLKEAKEAYWYPSEVDVSIRPGWFYHSEEDDKVRSIENLVEIYYRSVGSNSVLLLNIPPDKRGLIHEIDAARIKEFGAYIKQTFAKSYIANLNKTWRATAGESREFEIKKGAKVNTLLLQEDIAEGQRVESFLVECFEGGEWRELCTGTTIGYKRLLRFDDCHAERLRITITQTRATANIKSVGLYYAEPIAK